LSAPHAEEGKAKDGADKESAAPPRTDGDTK
jgi:hypothetical protein